MKPTYTAAVTRDGRFWLIRIDGVGQTQARDADEIEAMARDLIATVLDRDADSFALTIENSA